MRPSRRQILIALSVAIPSLVGLALVHWMLTREPTFYRIAERLEDPKLNQSARAALLQVTNAWNQIQNESNWQCTFDQQQLNAWLLTELPRRHAALLPPRVTRPQVNFAGDLASVAFDYHYGPIRTVLCFEVQSWISNDGRIAIEFHSARAGALRLSGQTVVNFVSNRLNSGPWRTDWKQRNGNPVLLLEPRDETRSELRITRIRVSDQAVMIAGRVNSRNR